MANGTVAQSVNRQTVAQALRQARSDCAESPRWLNAVNRAAVELQVSRWAFDGETLQIESATTLGTFYTVDAHGCDCKAGQAGKPCKHRAARRLLIKASELSTPAPKPVQTFTALQADVDALY